MRRDQLFKAVLKNCFQDFLTLFYPDVAERLDFETLKFLEKELFTDFPEGSRREADVVAEVKTHDGDPEILLVHVEVQFRAERDFARRMFRYYAALSLRYSLPIFPIVLYLYGGSGLTEEEYRVRVVGREQIRFRFAAVGLARLDPREYLEESPLGAALSALMNRKTVREPLALRASMLAGVLQSELDEARKYMLVDVIETYFELAADEIGQFRNLVPRKEYRKLQDIKLTWSDRIELGVKRDILSKQLIKKFGPLPEETATKVNAIESFDELDVYFERVLTASSLEEMELR